MRLESDSLLTQRISGKNSSITSWFYGIYSKTATVKFGQYNVPNTPALQKFYESQSLKEAMTQEFANNPHVCINYEADYYEAVKSKRFYF